MEILTELICWHTLKQSQEHIHYLLNLNKVQMVLQLMEIIPFKQQLIVWEYILYKFNHQIIKLHSSQVKLEHLHLWLMINSRIKPLVIFKDKQVLVLVHSKIKWFHLVHLHHNYFSHLHQLKRQIWFYLLINLF